MNISEFRQCTNCGACYNTCPNGAISVKKDGLFYTPMVNSEVCVDCSLCACVCPVNQRVDGYQPIYACAGWHRDKRIVLNSSSGGVFFGIAQHVLLDGGIVFGAVYSDDCKTVEFASSDDVPLSRMMKSKYVESLVGFSFQKIKRELEKGRSVLFCGTPCQVAGLHCYLGKTYDHLTTCDFACGGLPSHLIFQEYISEIERKYCSKAQSVDFRPKTHGWKRYAIQIIFKNGKEYLRLGTEDPYLRSFLYGKLTVRDYCMECKFPECHVSDITIADFWRHEKLTSLKHETGISLILCNTSKGKEMIDSIRERYIISDVEVEEASYNNHEQISEQKKDRHNAFLRKYEENGFIATYLDFMPNSLKTAMKNWAVRKLFRKRRT